MSDVLRLNYCSHAIEDLTEFFEHLPEHFRETALQLSRVTTLLDSAVKFLLPDHGDLVDINRVDDSMLGMMRLPYPLVALEYPYSPRGDLVREGPMEESPATRRIVLAWDHTFAGESALCPDYGEPGVYVLAVYYTGGGRQWVTSPLGAFMPQDNHVRTLAGDPEYGNSSGRPADRIVAETLLQKKSMTMKSPVLDAHYFPVLTQFVDMMVRELGAEAGHARMQMDVRDELLTAFGFCLTVNCVNVHHATVAPESKLNAKRIKSGKLPLYEYKVLALPEPKEASGTSPEFRLEGFRAGPRTHLRRGHPRRMADGRITFVRAALIGASNPGVVKKDYRVG